MKNRLRRVIGWISADALSPEEAADAAIAKVQEVCGRAAGVLHLDTVTGKLTLFADVDMPIPPGTFVRGVRFDSDPGYLADDLRSEALIARLIAGKAPKPLVFKPKRPKPPKPAPDASAMQRKLDAVALLIRGEFPVDEICKQYGITRSTIYRWRDEVRGKEAA